MPETRRFGAASFALLGLALSAAWALSIASQGSSAVDGAAFRTGARLSLLVIGAAFFVPLRLGPGRLGRALERLSWIVVGLVVVYGFAWSIYPVMPETAIRSFPRLAATALVPVIAILLASRSTLASQRALVPASVALLVVAAFDTGAVLRAPFAVAGVSALVLLALDERGRGALARLLRVGAHAGLAVALAFGLTRFLPWAQPVVEAYVARSMEGSGRGTSGFSLDSSLGSVDELALSPRVLMHVETSRPAKLRAAVFERFDGRRWELTPTTDVPVTCPVPGLGATLSAWLDQIPGITCADARRAGALTHGGVVRTRVVQLAPVAGVLPTPFGTLALRRAGPTTLNHFDLAGPPARSAETYAALSVPESAVVAEPTPGAVPPATRFVPEAAAEALGAFAASLSEAGASPAQRVAATAAFLRRGYRYSLKPGRFRTQQPVVEFLLEKKRGYCEYFASAAALLLRLQGVPTRYVRGFTVREANRLADRYVVREADAHAWIEAWLPHQGWVEVDPTPADQYEAAHGSIGSGGIETALLWLTGRLAELRAYLGAGDWRAFARRLLAESRELIAWCAGEGRGICGLLVASIVLIEAWRRGLLHWLSGRRTGPAIEGDLAPELRRLLRRLEAAWVRHGCARPVARGWREHLRLLPPEALPAPLREASEQAVECFYRARYAGVAVPPDEVRATLAALERASS